MALSIVQSTKRYDQWLKARLAAQGQAVDTGGLREKHRSMADPGQTFPFLRATFYHWVQDWLPGNSDVPGFPKVLAIGDLHLENFGTWRDAEGRLVWGVNDFDDACELPFAADLVRLATSAQIARNDGKKFGIGVREFCGQVLEGYRETLKAGRDKARPIILAEENGWLTPVVNELIGKRTDFWTELRRPEAKGKSARPKILKASSLDYSLVEAVRQLAPAGTEFERWTTRSSGLGSLGRPRILALGQFRGASLAREAKALIPSSYYCFAESDGKPSHLDEVLSKAVRCPDPYFAHSGDWIIRRLAPDCMKLTLKNVPENQQAEFAKAMGREVGNIHLGTPGAGPAILRHLNKLARKDGDWLFRWAEEKAEAVTNDRDEWRKHRVNR